MLIFFCLLLQVPILNQRELTIYLSVFDNNGNEFDDASSLHVEWMSSRHDIGEFTKQNTQYEQFNGNFANNQHGGTKSKY